MTPTRRTLLGLLAAVPAVLALRASAAGTSYVEDRFPGATLYGYGDPLDFVRLDPVHSLPRRLHFALSDIMWPPSQPEPWPDALAGLVIAADPRAYAALQAAGALHRDDYGPLFLGVPVMGVPA